MEKSDLASNFNIDYEARCNSFSNLSSPEITRKCTGEEEARGSLENPTRSPIPIEKPTADLSKLSAVIVFLEGLKPLRLHKLRTCLDTCPLAVVLQLHSGISSPPNSSPSLLPRLPPSSPTLLSFLAYPPFRESRSRYTSKPYPFLLRRIFAPLKICGGPRQIHPDSGHRCSGRPTPRLGLRKHPPVLVLLPPSVQRGPRVPTVLFFEGARVLLLQRMGKPNDKPAKVCPEFY
jgi:hypothetical protein